MSINARLETHPMYVWSRGLHAPMFTFVYVLANMGGTYLWADSVHRAATSSIFVTTDYSDAIWTAGIVGTILGVFLIEIVAAVYLAAVKYLRSEGDR